MKRGQLLIVIVAAIAVGAVALVSAGGGGDDESGGGTEAEQQAPANAVRLPFAYSPEKEKLLVPLIREFNREERRGVFVEGEVVSSGDAERRIAEGQLEPVIWSPASSLWGRLLNFDADRPLAPDDSPSIVRTPLVIAMWEPFARALGWPRKQIGFEQVIRLARSNQGFAEFGHPEFGSFKLVHTNPDFSTSGLSAVVAEYYAATGKKEGLTEADVTSSKARAVVRDIERSIVHYGDTTLFIADQMRENGPGYASAVAMEEVTLLDFNKRRGAQPRLVALYPPEGTFYSDNPFIVLDAPWVSAEAARGARSASRSSWPSASTPEVAARSGFRPADFDAEPVAPVSKENGVDPAQPERVLGLPEPRVLDTIKRTWREDRKPANVLLVVDTSGSMNDENRLVRAKQGLDVFFDQVGRQDSVGLTIFSDQIQPLIPVSPFTEVEGRMRDTVDNLIADGGTAIYDATIDGFEQIRGRGLGRAHQRGGAAHRRRGHRLAGHGRGRGERRARPGRLRQPGARVHDRLQRRGGGRRGGARGDRQGVGRPALRGRHRGHRGRLPQHLQLLLMAEQKRPYSRSEFNRALVANALTQPFNILLLAAVLIAGLLLDVFLPVLAVGLVVYGIAAARTYFDEDEANKVLEREKGKRRKALEAGRLDTRGLSEPIARLLSAGHQREARIRDAIERAELPYDEVSAEVDRFIRAMEDGARRAQLLYEALAETPPAWVEKRLGEVRGDPSKAELTSALENQLAVLRRMETQLQRFYDEMERVLVELDTVRGNLVSVSASTEAANQDRLAGEVRSLREEVGAVAAGNERGVRDRELGAGAQDLDRDLGHLRGVAAHAHALGLERLGLRGRGALRAGHDRAGVAHRLARRRGEAGDVGQHRLGDLVRDVLGRLLLGRAADLAAHHDQLGLGVGLEQLDDVDEARARHRVAADAHDRGVAEAALGQLVADLVGERARARHQADVALLEELGRDDPHVGLAGREDAGAVGARSGATSRAAGGCRRAARRAPGCPR